MSSNILYATISIAFVYFLWSYFSKKNLPPSPRGLPLIGHLHLLGRMPHHSLLALCQKFGPIMFLKLGAVPAIVVSNSDVAKEIFKTNDLSFASRPRLIAGKYIGYNYQDMAIAPYGEHWRNLRRLCNMELFTTRCLDSFQWVRVGEMKQILSSLYASHQANEVVNMRSIITSFTFNILSRILLGRRFSVDDKDAHEFKDINQEAVELTIKFNLSDFVPPWLGWLDWRVREFKRVHYKQDKFLAKMLEEHKRNKAVESKDFMDIMLTYFEQDGDRGETIVKAIVMDLITAGTDTTATAIEWALAELLHNPTIMRKAQDEINKVVGSSRMVQESDFAKLEYLQAIVKETFRLHPPSVILLPRMSTHASMVAGYDIPRGTQVLVNTYAMGRDPNVWRDPLQFIPERFIGSPMDVRGQDFELIPFGSGRRICPGMPLAMKAIQLMLSNLIHGFEWSFAPQKKHSLEDVYNSVGILKSPLEAVVTPRLSKEVYKF